METGTDSVPARRVPVKAEVRIQFEDLAGFVQAYAANISLTGMFLRTHQPPPAGTQLHFQLRLSDDFSLVEGVGEVVWRRPRDESKERPAGMGIRFLKIDQDSRELIFRVVDRHIQRGGEPFDLGAE